MHGNRCKGRATGRSVKGGVFSRRRAAGSTPSGRGRRLAVEGLETRVLLATGPLITEFMAANNSTLTDQDGRYSDWIEIHNPTDLPIALEGWSLTDAQNVLTRWQFPAVTLEAGHYLVVFASGNDRTAVPGELHTDFRLSRGGEFLALIRPDGATVESAYEPEYPRQVHDVSYGLSADFGTEGHFTLPTPGAPNVGEPLDDPQPHIRISEIMYHPASENDLEEYIELVN